MHAQLWNRSPRGDRGDARRDPAEQIPQAIEVVDWEVAETGPVEFEARPSPGRRWRMLVGLVAAMAIVVIGVEGQRGDGSTPRQAALAGGGRDEPIQVPTFQLTSPADGQAVDGAVVRVRGVAGGQPRVQLAVMAGDALLGSLVVDGRDGRVDADVPVYAPPVGVDVQLLAAILPGPVERAYGGREIARLATIRRGLRLRPAGPIGIWLVRRLLTPYASGIQVTGCAPLALGWVDVRLVAGDGRELASVRVPVTREGAVPGAAGGFALGMGAFEATLATPPEAGGDPASAKVKVDWRDEAGGAWGTSVEPVESDAPVEP
jgi:hypothetical protein